MPEPREVVLLHPLASGEPEQATTLLFAPPAANQQVRIRLVGVPVDGILDGTVGRWWPLSPHRTAAATPFPATRTALGNQQLGGQ